MFLKQVNYQWTCACQDLNFKICKKKEKTHFADFFYLASEAWIVCRLLSKVKNELKDI